MDELNTVKVIVLILLALIKLGSGLLPVLLDKVLQVKKVHIFLNYILYTNSFVIFRVFGYM